jgi:hypothetical protein
MISDDMKWNNIISFCLFFLTFPVSSLAGKYDAILENITPNSIVIIGEVHQNPESTFLFFSLIRDYLQHNKCLAVALEIPSNQQPILNKISHGQIDVSELVVDPIIDHPEYRRMLVKLIALKRQGSCIEIVAIDAGDEIDMSRDKWMSLRIIELGKRLPVLALLGDLHTLKKVNWLSENIDSPFVAEILADSGFEVRTFPQVWKKCSGEHQYEFIPGDSLKALTLLNENLVSLLNAHDFASTDGVIDGIILWQCKITSK